jgi:hypothetical protein
MTMTRIAKKSRVVKGKKKKKPLQTKVKKVSKKPSNPPRYTIRKDSLDRRYAIDKRTGKRVSVLKADNERIQRRKASAKTVPVFRRITPPKQSKTKSQHLKRSRAAKKGWETRRAKVTPKPTPILEPIEVFLAKPRPSTFAELGPLGPLIPEGMKVHDLGGIADRSEVYPNVKIAADFSWINLQVEAFARDRALHEGREPEPIITPRFDRLYGKGHGAHIRFDYYARAENLEDIDQMVETLNEQDDYDVRELYTLYFSPEIA